MEKALFDCLKHTKRFENLPGRKNKPSLWKLRKELSENDIVVISGLALGIDTYAHIGALKGGTIAVLGSGIVLRNAVGLVGVMVIIGICAMPIIKLGVLTALYQILSAICEPIADKKIINIIEQMRDTFKVLLGMVSAISIMLIIGVTIVIKVSSV